MALTILFTVPAQAQTGNGAGTQFELVFWQSVAGSDDPAVYEAYLEQYPTGTFSGLARAKLASLRKGATAVAVPVPAPVSARPVPVSERVSPAASLVNPPPAQVIAATPNLEEPVPLRPKVQLPQKNPRSEQDDSTLLEELAKSQEAGGGTMLVAASQGFSVPPRPVMSDVPDLPLPSAFCSAEQRNAFYETRYKPVMEITRLNNEAAAVHMQRLQQLYDSLQLARDSSPMNTIASEASAYKQEVATPVYNQQLEMVQRFNVIMAVPISTCQVATAK